MPALLGAGAVHVDEWLRRGRTRLRRGVLVAAVVLSAIVDGVIALPVLPADQAGVVVAVNPDVGETIGWPDLVRTIADVRRTLPAGAAPVILASNYGEAGAIDRFGPALGLPHAYSGHNAYALWGPPPDGAGPVIAVGRRLDGHLDGCRVAARINNTAGIGNDERGAPVMICQGPRRPWSLEWPSLRSYG